MPTRSLAYSEINAPIQGPPAILTHPTGTLTVKPGADAAAIQLQLATILAEKPKAERKVSSKSTRWHTPQPKRAPRYIGRSWTNRVGYLPNDTTAWRSLYLDITETIGGEPWPEAYARMKAIADAIGWQSWGAKPGDWIPENQAELIRWNTEWKAA